MGKPGDIIGTARDLVGQSKISAYKVDAVCKLKLLCGFSGKRLSGRPIEDHRFQFWIGKAEVDCIGPRSAAQVKESGTLRKIYLGSDFGTVSHRHIKHTHEKTLSLSLLPVMSPLFRFSCLYGLVELGPAV